MNTKYYIKENCRLCDSKDLDLVLKLNPSPLCDAYVPSKTKQDIFPLNLFLCKECGFVQIDCIIDPSEIYKDYLYITTSSTGLEKHFLNYSKSVINRLKLDSNSLAVDIGSNDGTLLKQFKKNNMQVLGVEPATEIANQATLSGIFTYAEYFNEILVKKILNEHGQVDVITANNVFANIDNLSLFTSNMVKLLSDNGVIIIESSYLKDMIENNVFDFIYHEHLSYFSILPLQKFFSKYNMKLIDLEKVPTKGGSMRYYFSKNSSKRPINPEVSVLITNEEKAELNKIKTYKNFEEKINFVKKKLLNKLDKINNKVCVGYGASATSTTLIHHFELQNYIHYLVDDNPTKIGTYSPGLNLHVKDSNNIISDNIDVTIILAWRYADQIIKKHPNYKGQFIIPID